MTSLATSRIAPIIGQCVPVRGPARLLYRSFAKIQSDSEFSPRIVRTKFGYRFVADMGSFLEWQLWAFGCYEPNISALLAILVRAGDVCVDVGANVGIHTIRLASLVGPAGRVIAVEPAADLAGRIDMNAELNDLRNVRVVVAAATAESGRQVRLYRPERTDANHGRASLIEHAYLTGSVQSVSSVTVDDLVPGAVSLIKIDVEGYEGAVLSGARKCIARSRPSVIFEYDPDLRSKGCPDPFDLLACSDYHMFDIGSARGAVTSRIRLKLTACATAPTRPTNVLAVSDSRIGVVRDEIKRAANSFRIPIPRRQMGNQA